MLLGFGGALECLALIARKLSSKKSKHLIDSSENNSNSSQKHSEHYHHDNKQCNH